MKIEDIEPGKYYKIDNDRGFKFIIPYNKAIKMDERYCIATLVFFVYSNISNIDIYSLHKPTHMFWLDKDDKITKASNKTCRIVLDKLFSSENKAIMI